MHLPIRACILLAATLALGTAPAHAAESYDNCSGFVTSLPAVISTQGVWCLNADLATTLATGPAITIATNNVTLDCNNFKLGGLGAGSSTLASGVYAENRLNLTVRNCNIRGFHYGVRTDGGGGHVIEDNSMDRNRFTSISIISDGSIIRRNQVVDGGASSTAAGTAIGIYSQGNVDILDNVVNGVTSLNADAIVYGIRSFGNVSGSIRGNRVRGISAVTAADIRGIHATSSARVVIQDNIVQNSGTPAGTGILCSVNSATARTNVVAGFANGITGCSLSGNLVNAL